MDNKDNAKQYLLYAMQRIDLLLISISGAGIYGGWEIFKYVKDRSPLQNFCLLEISQILFLVTIVLNFLAQWFSYNTHWNEIIGKEQIRDLYSKWVVRLNTVSTITFIGGLICISIFSFTCLGS